MLAGAFGLTLVFTASVPVVAATTQWAVTAQVTNDPGTTYDFAVDDAANTLYVADRYNDSVRVLNRTTFATIATITDPSIQGPIAIAYDVGTGNVIVANYTSDQATVISAATNTVVATFNTGFGTSGVAVNQSTNTMYVASSTDLFVIDGSTLTLSSVHTISGGPFHISVDQSTGTIYSPDQNNSLVQAINPTTFAVTNIALPAGSGPQDAVVDSTTHMVYSANRSNGTVSVIDGTTDTYVTTITPPVRAPSGSLTQVAIDEATNTVAVLNGDGLDFINGATNTVVQNLDFPDTSGTFGGNGLVWDPSTNAFYTHEYQTASVGDIYRVQYGTSPTISVAELTNGHLGNAYTGPVTATGTGTITFSITSGALPPGLSLDPATGVISGTPSTSGTYTYSVTATNSFGTDTAAYTQIIGAHLPIVSG